MGNGLQFINILGFTCCVVLFCFVVFSSIHITESTNVWVIFIFEYIAANILGFWVSSHVHLGVRASSPSAFSTHLTIQAETLVPAPTKSCRRSFAVTWGLLTTCLLRSLVAATGSLLFLSHPSGAASVPFTLNLGIMLPTVPVGKFSAFAIFLYPFPCLYKAMDSANYFSHISNVRTNVTVKKPLTSYIWCALISSTPEATNETLD